MAAKVTASDKSEGQEPASKAEKATPHDQIEQDAKETDAESSEPAKRDAAAGGRKRKRHLYNSIRSQMEFYFGDANLTKDRFLRRYVNQDPYVPLEIFLTFNKMKPLAQDVKEIAKALNNSKLLELDESALKVRRKTKLPDQRDVNDKTLYVEALPANASHDWLKEVFSRYGPVAYVSLPHYPDNKKIKEFAFIEFERSTALEKAVKAFAQVQGVLSLDTDPAVLASVRSFQQQQQQSKNVDASQEDANKRGRKRDLASCRAKEEDQHDIKRLKLEHQPSEASTAEETASESDQEASTAEEEENGAKDDQTAGEGEGAGGGEADEAKKRRRKRKKKAIIDKPNIDPTAVELKVLPKTSWCSLRNKYLNLQRRLVSVAKAKLWRESQQQQLDPNHPRKRTPMQATGGQQLSETKTNNTNASVGGGGEEGEPLSDADDGGGATEASVPVPPKRRKAVHKMNMNFYGAGGGETDDSRSAVRTEDPSQERTPLFKYEPGLIVECTLHEPCTNIKEFKTDMRQYPDIKYVDIKEGDQAATLRMATPTAAEELVRQLSCAERQLKVLDGQAETQYWRKIEQDREAKLTKKVRVQQKRGREKVSKVLAKHTKFDDGDDDVGAVCEPSSGPPTEA
ncbi:la-related protein 7-like [Drosophila miranda]|uniref:la-related protein 7-like n=1 Tax=Drosophila miranda TaxID=7229 RepID=UPI00143F0CE2|nr:la-related protein 7-like [Drosophila miranda]